ncbi:adenylate cyclase fragment [Pseudozyma hubeiensis SY62]|uniref:Adenylate cyclase n=1 Tax=Pseudozyma hubeiensis (strain SY62) TaxID=1305764 RepID=R9P2T7_PSEHS|nr:adenylate cyclase fragment [Pseudozyma hubeiensis SY62]GAC95733.1 adenylate cyclase fragment [Pseudozyma hubeiensis SY62]
MDSIPGDRYIGEYARWLRIHESKLGDAAASAAAAKRNAAAKSDPSVSSLSSTFWNVVSLGTAGVSSTAPAPAARPMLLRQNPHNLFYLLIRFEELSLPVGSLDTSIPSSARPTSYFSFVSATPSSKRIDDTMSISSMRSRISVVSSSLNSSLSWFSASKPDPTQDLKYIYSCFTKIPSLRLGPVPPRRLVQDFEDCPGQSAVPLDVFRNLQMLELDEVDPRTLMGWDRVCVGLRGLTCRRSGVEDLTGLVVGLVAGDARRRRGEKVGAKSSGMDLSASTTTATDTDTEDNLPGSAEAALTSIPDPIPTLPPDLPSFAWHSLRYLNLSSNALTSIPILPLLPLTSLTHLDLSSNLLNSIPPSLSHLPSLTSLNISDNLIDSVLGIYHSIPHITVLNLSHNRLESLCGVERLFALQRIDLRHNSIYEAGEVGRLAVLKGLQEVWVGSGNALVEEYVDWRVECFVEFAREGREKAVKLDGEGLGWWEAQRVSERLPAVSGKEGEGGGRMRGEEMEAQLAKDVATTSGVVRNVRRAQSRVMETARGRGSDLLGVEGAGSTSRSRSGSRSRTSGGQAATSGAARRRNQRVVELESSPQKPSSSTRQRTLTESDRIKQAALARDGGAAVDAEPEHIGGKSDAVSSSKTLGKGKAVDVGVQEEPANSAVEPHHSAALAAHSTLLFALPPGSTPSEPSSSTKQRSLRKHRNPADSRTASDLFASSTSPAAQDTRSHVTSIPHNPDGVESKSSFAAEANGNSGKAKSDALRRRIEALKSEVGDDWLRLLARGEGDERRVSVVRTEADQEGDAAEKDAQ